MVYKDTIPPFLFKGTTSLISLMSLLFHSASNGLFLFRNILVRVLYFEFGYIYVYINNFIATLVYSQVTTIPDRANNNLEHSSESVAHEFISTITMIMSNISCC